jgi:hypothetical protein
MTNHETHPTNGWNDPLREQEVQRIRDALRGLRYGTVRPISSITVQYYQPIDNGVGSEPGPNVLPPKLALPDSTDISVRLTEGPNKLVPIEVRR